MGWMTAAQAAEHLGITPDRVRQREIYRASRQRDPKDMMWRYWVPIGREFESPQATPKSSTPTAIASLWDAHHPDVDHRIWNSCLQFLTDTPIDIVVVGGDFVEASSVSSHGGDPDPPSLLQDAKAGHLALKQIREALPDAKIHYIEGNHESRLGRATLSNIPALHGALDWPSLMAFDELGVNWYKDKPLVIGDTLFTHGNYTSVHHAKKMGEVFRQNVVYGHTHKCQFFSRGYGYDNGIIQSWGMPCMRTMQPHWLHGAPSGWTQGFGYHLLDPATEKLHTQLILAQHGIFAWGGKLYRPCS